MSFELAGAESIDATEGHADFADAELLDVERMELADAEPSTSTMCFDGLQVGEERLDKSCSTVTAPKPSGVCLSMFSTARSVYMDLRVEVLQLSDGLEDNERVPVEVLHGPERVGIDCASKSGSTLTASKTSGRCLSKFSTARACWHRLAR